MQKSKIKNQTGFLQKFGKIILFSFFAFCFSGFFNFVDALTINSQTPNAGGDTLKNGLVGWWTFDGADLVSNVTDKSGSGNNGNMSGFTSTTTAQTGGVLGQALKFDGSDDGINISTVADDIATGSFSLSFWFRAPASSLSSTDRFLFSLADSPSLNDAEIYTNNNVITFRMVNNSVQYVYATSGSVSWIRDRWYHIVATFSTIDGMKLYRDNVLVGSGANTTRGTPASAQAYISRRHSGLYSRNVMDDFRIYNRALIASEIQKLYNQGGSKLTSQTLNVGGDTLKSGLVGHWTFDGADLVSNVADKSGNGNNGNMSGFTSTTTAQTGGVLGQALKFDGVNDYVNVPAATSINDLSSLSVSFWAKPNSLGSFRAYISKADNASGGHGWQVVSDSTISSRLEFLVPGFTTTDLSVISSSGALVNGQWAHYVVTWDGSSTATNVHMYKNGVELSYASQTNGGSVSPQSDSSRPIRMGRDSGNSTNYINGSLDDVRIYNRALSASEIQKLYNQGGSKLTSQTLNVGGDTLKSGLVGHWTFDGADLVSNVADKSGNGNNGNMSGFTSTTTAQTGGVLGQALKFDGVNDYVQVTDANTLEPNSVNISAWVKTPNVWPSISSFVAKRATSVDGFFLFYFPSSGGINFDWGGSSGRWSTNVSLNTNTWYHISASFNATNNLRELYINGVRRASVISAKGTGAIGNSSNLFFSRDSSADQYILSVVLDDIRIYNRALSASEVKKLYNMGR